MLELTLIPAYGSDYNTMNEVLAGWALGHDFQIATVASKDYARYTSIRDLSMFPGEHVKLRYNNLEDFVLINIATGEASC